jgi:IS30 family transposase
MGPSQEMAGHKRFTLATVIQVYFYEPRNAWQRGSHEDKRGLKRVLQERIVETARHLTSD